MIITCNIVLMSHRCDLIASLFRRISWGDMCFDVCHCCFSSSPINESSTSVLDRSSSRSSIVEIFAYVADLGSILSILGRLVW